MPDAAQIVVSRALAEAVDGRDAAEVAELIASRGSITIRSTVADDPAWLTAPSFTAGWLVSCGGPAPALTPAAKRALLDAHQISRALGSSYIGPEHILLALAVNPESAVGRMMSAG